MECHYLNQQPRGGTLFFRARGESTGRGVDAGYPRASDELEVCGNIEGRFNRLAIYPGFVLHSGKIEGEWIESDEQLHLAAPHPADHVLLLMNAATFGPYRLAGAVDLTYGRAHE